MKRVFTWMLVAVLAIALSGCVRSKQTVFNVKVIYNDGPVVGTLVYMYETTINDYSYSYTYMAESATPTENDGIASIPLDEFEFIGNAGQVSYRFVTYDANKHVNGNILASIKYGETKDLVIELLYR